MTTKARVAEADLARARAHGGARPNASAAPSQLDSASTFECIVEGDRHYFMEVNTRIQVEHRVSELCYALRFTNPDDPNDSFDVHSLVEAMALIAKHKQRLPQTGRACSARARPSRSRLNATDRALHPAAGGVIMSWSDPIDGEIRDDQGISHQEPGHRPVHALPPRRRLRLQHRAAAGDRRRPRDELGAARRDPAPHHASAASTSPPTCEFHFGLVTWFLQPRPLGQADHEVRRPVPHPGRRARAGGAIDRPRLRLPARSRAARTAAAAARGEQAIAATRHVIELKETLLERPITHALRRAALPLGVAVASTGSTSRSANGHVVWRRNPVEVLVRDLSICSHLDDQPGEPAAHRHLGATTSELLDTALALLRAARRAGRRPDCRGPSSTARLRGDAPAFGFDADAVGQRARRARRPPARPRDPRASLPLLGAQGRLLRAAR